MVSITSFNSFLSGFSSSLNTAMILSRVRGRPAANNSPSTIILTLLSTSLIVYRHYGLFVLPSRLDVNWRKRFRLNDFNHGILQQFHHR